MEIFPKNKKNAKKIKKKKKNCKGIKNLQNKTNMNQTPKVTSCSFPSFDQNQRMTQPAAVNKSSQNKSSLNELHFYLSDA